MKQQVSFFQTESAQALIGSSSFLMQHVGQAVMGFIWVSILWLFIMFAYQYNFIYYKKGVLED